MKRIILLAAAGAAIAVSVRYARRHRKLHAAELAGNDVIIDEVVVHFGYDDDARWGSPSF